MSFLIRDSKQLDSTVYIELYPDHFSGSHWNSNSIFLEEHHWEFLRPIVQRRYPAYDPYGFQTINQSIWALVLQDFEALSKRLEAGARFADIRDEISFTSDYTESEYRSDEGANLERLKTTIDELKDWISCSVEKSGFVSVLGL